VDFFVWICVVLAGALTAVSADAFEMNRLSRTVDTSISKEMSLPANFSFRLIAPITIADQPQLLVIVIDD